MRSRYCDAKVHQLPERGALACGPDIGVARMRLRRRSIDAGFQPGTLALECCLFCLQGLTLRVERDPTLREMYAGLLLGDLQALSRRIVALQGDDPIGQSRERREIVVCADAQLRQAVEVAFPGLEPGFGPPVPHSRRLARVGSLHPRPRPVSRRAWSVAGHAGFRPQSPPRGAAATAQSVRVVDRPKREARIAQPRKRVASTRPVPRLRAL